MSAPAQAPAQAAGLAVVVALAIVYVVWGSTYLAIRFALEGGWPPLLAVSGARFLVAGGAMYAFLRWRGVPAPTGASCRLTENGTVAEVALAMRFETITRSW